MEKGALLPIRFYPALSWTDYERFTNKMGKDFALLKEHNLYAPSFQMTMPDTGRHWGTLDLTTIEIIEYDLGTTYDLTTLFLKDPSVYSKAGYFRSLVNSRFPLFSSGAPRKLPAGKYYYHITDFDETEWYSEIFELCDFELNALTATFANDANWANFSAAAYDGGGERIGAQFCKSATGAGDATAYTEIEVFLGEELDFYIVTADNTLHGGCAVGQWNDPIYFELRDSTGLVVSETVMVDTTTTQYTFALTAQIGGTVRLYMYMLDADTGKGNLSLVFLQRRYAASHNQIRYSNSVSTCKIFYEDDYENVFFIDSKQVIDQNAIEENVVEDDEANKYRIIGTNQKWNSIHFVAGEAMLNAMSLLRLHDEIKIIRETGEVMDIVEILLEQSVIDYEASDIKLVYREESCSVEACGFDDCCPTLDTPIMQDVYSGVGALPVAGADNNGWYAMVVTAVDEYTIYLSNGAAWNVDNTYDIEDDCVEARQSSTFLRNRFFWYEAGAVNAWRNFIELPTVNDNADGTADLITDTEYRDGLTCRGEYQDADGVWNECTDPVDLVAGGGAITLVTYSSVPGVGTWTFRLHIYTDSCDYGYSEERTQTIT